MNDDSDGGTGCGPGQGPAPNALTKGGDGS
jgi:hypothetical protein